MGRWSASAESGIISFKDGKFHSLSCDKWGFGTGVYKATATGDTIAFETETVSPTDGTLKWRGVMKDKELEGTFTHLRKPAWYRPDPEPVEHWFRATLQ